jgi:hypothetical protein
MRSGTEWGDQPKPPSDIPLGSLLSQRSLGARAKAQVIVVRDSSKIDHWP